MPLELHKYHASQQFSEYQRENPVQTDTGRLYVIKRDGRPENVSYDKITARILRLCSGLNMRFIDPAQISWKVIQGIYAGVTTCQLDNLAVETCAMMSTVHPDYGTLAARIFTNNLHKETEKVFSNVVEKLYNHVHPKTGEHMPLVAERFYHDVLANKDELNSAIIYDRDYSYSFFGLKTLERAYLLRINEKVAERPQHLLMRVAVALHGQDMGKILETYNDLSMRYFIHATPTLFNAGTMRAGLSSCFLLTATSKDDSIENIYKLLSDCAIISKYSGGIGVSVHDIRAKGSLIRSTNGKSEGIIPMLVMFDKSARFVTQSNKRPGSVAVYLEPWHAEIREFLRLKENAGAEEFRARSLFYGLWIPDLFMKKAKSDDPEYQQWALFCPNEAPGLADVYGDEFEALYDKYVREGRHRETMSARDLLYAIIESQIKTGGPYMLYKDSVNRKNNQKHIGTIRNSNLCVAPETRILTSTGYHEISKLRDKSVKVWNGNQFSETTVRKTSECSELLKVTFSNGSVLECTEYHKFYLQDNNKNQVLIKEAQDLQRNDKLIKAEFPVIEEDLASRLDGFKQLCGSSGLLTNKGIAINNPDQRYLNDVKLTLQTMGVDASVRQVGGQENSVVDNNPTQQATYVLSLVSKQLHALQLWGFELPERLASQEANEDEDETDNDVKIVSVERTGRQDATYCFNEPLEHKGIFNGVITGQCCEITEFTFSEETSTCNLGSIGLPTYIKYDKNGNPSYDYQLLHAKTKVVTKNLDRVIDETHYPIEKARYSNMRHRPIGVGVSGLADTFSLMRYPFDSPEAREMNKTIFETIYHACIEASCELAEELGAYETYPGSEFSKGKFQWNLWEEEQGTPVIHSGLWDWDKLRENVLRHGVRNSLLTAPMPTASTSQIIGFNEAFEPYSSNIFKRETLSGEFQLVNKHLLNELCDLGVWNEHIKDQIIARRGSVQGIPEIPEDVQARYKTVWETSQRVIIDMAADRGPYVDQSQSMNIFMAEPNFKKMSALHMYTWSKGLKTGCYYLKSKAAAAPLQFSVGKKQVPTRTTATEPSQIKLQISAKELADAEQDIPVCRMEEGCVSCSG